MNKSYFYRTGFIELQYKSIDITSIECPSIEVLYKCIERTSIELCFMEFNRGIKLSIGSYTFL
jgi:hypothetical protein